MNISFLWGWLRRPKKSHASSVLAPNHQSVKLSDADMYRRFGPRVARSMVLRSHRNNASQEPPSLIPSALHET
jgi:hypothetical protein